MCIGIPMQVVDAGESSARCEGRGARHELDMLLVGPQPPGAWLLAFRGCAVRVLAPEEAARIDAALDALEAALAGAEDFDAFFPDLTGREPAPPSQDRTP